MLVTTAPLAVRRAGAAARADPRRRRPRRGAGAAAEAVAGRPQGGAGAAAGDAAAAGQHDGVAQRRGRATAPPHGARRCISPAAARCAMSRADEADAPRLLRPKRRRRAGRQGIRRRRAHAAGARCRARSTVRASAEDGALLAREPATIAAGESQRRAAAADADRAAQPDHPHRDRGRGIGRRRAAGRRALAPPAGRHRRRAEHRRPAAAQRELLSRARARPVHRSAPRPRAPIC